MLTHRHFIAVMCFLFATSFAEAEHDIWSAAKEGDLVCSRKLIQLGADINEYDSRGGTPLHYASRLGHDDLVTLLIEHGASVNIGNSRNGVTPLMVATSFFNNNIVKILLENGANPNADDAFNFGGALHMAAHKNNYQAVEILIRHGALVGTRTSKTLQTPLHRAAYSCSYESFLLLLLAGANPWEMDARGNIPIDIILRLYIVGLCDIWHNASAPSSAK
jgi:ankyrin repeat protein